MAEVLGRAQYVCRAADAGGQKTVALVSQRLGVIAGGSGDDAALLLIGRKLRKRVARAALLETSGPLQVVELAKNLHAGDFAERNVARARRVVDGVFNAIPCRFDVVKRNHALQMCRKIDNRQLRRP